MADLKTVLTETLRAHTQADEYGYPVEECRCGASFTGDYAEHVANVLLGLSGVAVTQLPESDWRKPADDDENGAAAWEYPDGEVVVYDDGSYEWRALGINSDDPSRLRDGAAALLAAGVFSEGATND